MVVRVSRKILQVWNLIIRFQILNLEIEINTSKTFKLNYNLLNFMIHSYDISNNFVF